MKTPPSLKIAKLVVAPAGSDGPAKTKQIVIPPPTGPPISDFLSVKQAATYLMVSKSFLDKLRVNGGGPGFMRLSARKILYRRSDLDNWARERRFESTAQYLA
jgi:excisionase family DNA binding protein